MIYNMILLSRDYIKSILKDNTGANAVEYGLIMALVAVFIVAGVLAMSSALGDLFNAMATCINAVTSCNAGLF